MNPRPTDYKSVALPTELGRHKWWRLTGSNRWPLACKASALPAELNLRSNGDPYGIRTRVTAVKGRCLNHLTNGPKNGSTGRTRTYDPLINSQMLLPTELLWKNPLYKKMERVMRIELTTSVWKTEVLPLNYTRIFLILYFRLFVEHSIIISSLQDFVNTF